MTDLAGVPDDELWSELERRGLVGTFTTVMGGVERTFRTEVSVAEGPAPARLSVVRDVEGPG